MNNSLRHFRAHAFVSDGHVPGHLITAATFEEAAISFIEQWATAEPECHVTVRDQATGEQHCFSIHLDGELTEGC